MAPQKELIVLSLGGSTFLGSIMVCGKVGDTWWWRGAKGQLWEQAPAGTETWRAAGLRLARNAFGLRLGASLFEAKVWTLNGTREVGLVWTFRGLEHQLQDFGLFSGLNGVFFLFICICLDHTVSIVTFEGGYVYLDSFYPLSHSLPSSVSRAPFLLLS